MHVADFGSTLAVPYDLNALPEVITELEPRETPEHQ